jgi:ketosteroid isomerase-like protein
MNLLLTAALLVGLTSGAPATAGAIEKQIATLEQRCNEAYAANDLDKYFGFYDDSLSAIFYNDRSTLPAYRKMWTESVHEGNVVTSVKLSDMQVRILEPGNVAIASYQIDVGNRHADGKTTDETAFETDVWIKRKAGWKITHAHYALATPPPT